MTRVEAGHRFGVPVERGFAFITDPENWPKYWPGYVRLAAGSRWRTTGDVAHLVTRVLGRERELTMTITGYELNRLVTYRSTQDGLPDALHERHFTADGPSFIYRLAVEYQPRRGLVGVYDRLLLPRAIRGLFKRTIAALERELDASPSTSLPPDSSH